VTDHAKLRELAEWATPGKWFPETYSDGHRQVCGDHRFVDDDEETYTTIADVHNRSDQEYLVAANPLTIIALIDENDSLRKRLSEALLSAERAREERNREHVRLNAEWMAKCEELRNDAERTDAQIVSAIRKANIALVNGLPEKAVADAFRSATNCEASPSGHPCNLGAGHEGPCGMTEGKQQVAAWIAPVELDHLQKGYRNSAVICRGGGAYTMPLYADSAPITELLREIAALKRHNPNAAYPKRPVTHLTISISTDLAERIDAAMAKKEGA
jgi:hypothetical protein